MRRFLVFLLVLLAATQALAMTPQRKRIILGGGPPLARGLTFYAPLRSNLVPQVAGSPASTFSRASSATYIDGAGTVQTATSGVARFDFAAAGQGKSGVAIEPLATNIALRSEAIDNATWSKSNASVTADATTGPDGNATADLLIPNAVNTSHFAQQTLTLSASTTYVFSDYFKPGGYSFAAMRISSGGVSYTQWFNVGTGSVGSSAGGPTGAGVIPCGNGWYRCWVSAPSGTATSPSVIIYATNADNTTVLTGDTTSGIYAWGAQLETGSTPTSYIPTTTATVTRIADVLTYPAAGNISTSGTIVLWARTTYSGAVNGGSYGYIDTQPSPNRILLQNTGTAIRGRVWDSAGNSVFYDDPLDGTVWPANTWHQIAFSWDANGPYPLYIDKVSVAQSKTGSTFVGISSVGTTVNVGQFNTGGGANADLRDVRIYNRVLSSAEVASLNSLEK